MVDSGEGGAPKQTFIHFFFINCCFHLCLVSMQFYLYVTKSQEQLSQITLYCKKKITLTQNLHKPLKSRKKKIKDVEKLLWLSWTHWMVSLSCCHCHRYVVVMYDVTDFHSNLMASQIQAVSMVLIWCQYNNLCLENQK